MFVDEQKIKQQAQNYLTNEEKVEKVAIEKPVLSFLDFSPNAVVLTNRRFMVFSFKLFGLSVSFVDYQWQDLSDATIQEKVLRATFSMQTVKGTTLAVSNLAKNEAREIYRLAQQKEEEARQYRHQKEVELNSLRMQRSR